jgi:hypothetical protein
MAKPPGRKHTKRKAAKTSRVRARSSGKSAGKKASKKKAAKKKAAKKNTAKKASRKSASKKVARKTATKSPARKSAGKKAAGKSRGGSGASSRRATAPKIAGAPPLPSYRPLTAGVVLRNAVGCRPVSPERLSGKPGSAARKVNLRTGVARPARGRRPLPSAGSAPDAPWPALHEPASETALRERILVCVLSMETQIAGRPRDPALPSPETVMRCAEQMLAWFESGAVLSDGRTLSRLLFESLVADEMAMLRETLGAESYDNGAFGMARAELLSAILSEPDISPTAGA